MPRLAFFVANDSPSVTCDAQLEKYGFPLCKSIVGRAFQQAHVHRRGKQQLFGAGRYCLARKERNGQTSERL